MAVVSFDDFKKLEIITARIENVRDHPNADKLLVLKIDLGDEQRQIIAGVKAYYAPETLVGREVVVVTNLAPRKMKFGTSEGMITAAGPGGKDIYLLFPDDGAKPGQRVH